MRSADIELQSVPLLDKDKQIVAYEYRALLPESICGEPGGKTEVIHSSIGDENPLDITHHNKVADETFAKFLANLQRIMTTNLGDSGYVATITRQREEKEGKAQGMR